MATDIDPCTTSRYHDFLIAADVEVPGEVDRKERCLFRVSVDQETGSYATDKLVEKISLQSEGARKVFQGLKSGLVMSTLPTKPEIDGFTAFCYLLNINNLQFCTAWNEPQWSAPLDASNPTTSKDNSKVGDVYVAVTKDGVGKVVRISGEAIMAASEDESASISEISPNPKHYPSIWSHLRDGAVVSKIPGSVYNPNNSYLVNLESLYPKKKGD